MGLIDLLFPTYCVICQRWGEYLCARCFAKLSFDVKHLCCVCNKPSVDGLTHPVCQTRYSLDGVFCALSYKHIINSLLYQFKYEPYLSHMAGFLTTLMYESLIQKEIVGEMLSRGEGVLIPIPLHRKRERTRGYNQSRLLAQKLGELVHMPVSNCLIRQKNTKAQFGLSPAERKSNMRDAFVLTSDIEKSIVFLVDDVLTTGSTLMEAARVLKHNGARRVYGLCLAREQNE